jgi:hypothetical protein
VLRPWSTISLSRPGRGHWRRPGTRCDRAFVGDQRIDVDAGSYAALPKDVPHGLSVRGDEARLLITLEPAGTEYFLVPRDENDADPNRFGLILYGPVPAA